MTCSPLSHVQGYRKKNKFIITQGPLPNTSRDFWKMIYERNATSIVMLSGMVENEEVSVSSSSLIQYAAVHYDVHCLSSHQSDGLPSPPPLLPDSVCLYDACFYCMCRRYVTSIGRLEG